MRVVRFAMVATALPLACAAGDTPRGLRGMSASLVPQPSEQGTQPLQQQPGRTQEGQQMQMQPHQRQLQRLTDQQALQQARQATQDQIHQQQQASQQVRWETNQRLEQQAAERRRESGEGQPWPGQGEEQQWGWNQPGGQKQQQQQEQHSESMYIQGWAKSGTNGAVPVNACFNLDRTSNALKDCDGKQAADMFCREKQFSFAKAYQVVPLEGEAPRSVVLGADHAELELHMPNQHALADVTCGR